MADWELAGGVTETEDGRKIKDDGVLEKFDLTIEEARNLIMSARVELGLVDPEALTALYEEQVLEEGADEGAEEGAEEDDAETEAPGEETSAEAEPEN